MAHDLHRAALALVCVFAVVFGASLFPATGFGTNPVPAGGGGPGDSPASTGPATGGPTTGTETATGANRETRATDTATTTAESSGASSDDPGTTTTVTTTRSGAYDQSSSGGLQGALLAFGAILLFGTIGFVAVAVGFGRHHRRRNPDEWDLPDAPHLRVLAYVRRVPQTSLAFAMFAGANAPAILDRLGAWTGDASSGLAAVTNGLGRAGATLGAGLLKAPAGLLAGVGAIVRGIGSLTLSVPSLFSGFGTGTVLGGGDARPGSDPRSGGDTETTTADPEPPEPPGSVREAWERLQADLGVRGDDPRTPGEIARSAVDRGVPTDAVRTLTRTFRDVRYGGQPDDGERTSVARDAYQRIRTALDGDSS